MQRSHLFALHEQREVVTVLLGSRLGENQAGTGLQRPPVLPDRQVEGGCGFDEHTVIDIERELILLPQELIGDRSMGDRYALGLSGGSGGVNRIRDVVRVQGCEAFCVPNGRPVDTVQLECVDVHDVVRPVD
ncbi:hypothetical protein BKP42_20720 [Rhodococcus erythropolis]|nr:hypothetical protein BKP42_20720 [Rhodococcus erythropolis]